MDQIGNLSLQGQYDQNKKKYGKWIAFWNKTLLENVGGESLIIIYILYYKEGQKQGLWKDLFLNYSNKVHIFEIGQYYNGFRIRSWDYFQGDRKIGSGYQNMDGKKLGKWIEVDEGFQDYKKVTYNGEYKKNNLKVGRWDIMYCKDREKEYKQIIFKYTKWWWII